MGKQKGLFYRLVAAQAALAMAGNDKERAADLGAIEYQRAVRRYHVAKRAYRRALAALNANTTPELVQA